MENKRSYFQNRVLEECDNTKLHSTMVSLQNDILEPEYSRIART